MQTDLRQKADRLLLTKYKLKPIRLISNIDFQSARYMKLTFLNIGKVKSVEKTRNSVDFICEHGRVRVAVLSGSIVRIVETSER